MTTSRRLRLAVGAIACFMIVSAAQCSTEQPPTGDGKPILQFAGDSITVQSTPDINAHYSGTYDVGIDATIGNDTYWMTHGVAAQAAEAPAVEIINLGTNDATRIANGFRELNEPPVTLPDVESRLTTFATEFPASTCVIFVNVNAHNPSWGPEPAQAIDDFFVANPTTFPHVVDWNGAWQSSYFDKADTPHPNETGRQALLALEDSAIASCTPAS